MSDARHAAALDAVLEALSFERRPNDARAFEDLFLRFSRRVACETLTRPAGDPEAFDAGSFFAEWVDEERGLVGAERALAFAWLARELGFEVATFPGSCRRPWEERAPERDEVRLGSGEGDFSSKVNGGRAHRTVIATIEGRRILADAAFPMPVLLPLDPPAAEIPTGIGRLSTAVVSDGSVSVTCDARGEVAELLRLDPTPSESSFPFEERAFALRVLDDRVLYWRAGRMTILDAWSRLEYALPASRRGALEKLFALDLEGVALAEETLEEPVPPATLRVFHESPVSADEARRRIARDAPPLSLVVGREVRIEEAGTGSRITIMSPLAPTLPPEGPTEAVRKTLVFHLVSEIFELSR